MLVQLTPPHPTSTASPAQQVAAFVGLQISQSAHQLQEIIGKAATLVSAAVTTTAGTPVAAVIHVGAAMIADTAISMANKEVDQALSLVADPLGAGTSMIRDQIGSTISHQASALERKVESASSETDPTTPNPEGKASFLSESNSERYESPQSFGEILFGKGRKERAEGPAQRKSIVSDSLGLPKKSALMPSLAA